jgi:hypothetical protein
MAQQEQTKITAQIPASLAEALRERAVAEDRSISSLIRLAVSALLTGGRRRQATSNNWQAFKMSNGAIAITPAGASVPYGTQSYQFSASNDSQFVEGVNNAAQALERPSTRRTTWLGRRSTRGARPTSRPPAELTIRTLRHWSPISASARWRSRWRRDHRTGRCRRSVRLRQRGEAVFVGLDRPRFWRLLFFQRSWSGGRCGCRSRGGSPERRSRWRAGQVRDPGAGSVGGLCVVPAGAPSDDRNLGGRRQPGRGGEQRLA